MITPELLGEHGTFLKLFCKTEIDELDYDLLLIGHVLDHDIVRFDIAMCDVVRVQIVDRREKLTGYVFGFFLTQGPFLFHSTLVEVIE
jgi:hypothetical protein